MVEEVFKALSRPNLSSIAGATRTIDPLLQSFQAVSTNGVGFLPLTWSDLKLRHVVHVGGPLRLCRGIRRRRLVLQLAQGILHRRQRIYDERERSRLTLGLLAAPALTLVQGQVPHAVVRRSAVIVVRQLLERCPSWKAVPFEAGRRKKKEGGKKKERRVFQQTVQGVPRCFRYDVRLLRALTKSGTRDGDECQQCENGDQSRSYRGRAHLERRVKGLKGRILSYFSFLNIFMRDCKY